MLLCWLIDETGAVMASYDRYLSLDYERPYQSAGNFTLVISRQAENVELLQKGLIFGVDEPNKQHISQIYRIEQLHYTMDGEEDVLEVSGRSLSGIIEDRVVLPDVGSGYDTIKNTNTRDAINHYVSKNLGPEASLSRQIPSLVIEQGVAKGQTIKTYQARYKQLDEVLLELAQAASFGWEITYDRVQHQFIFRIISGEETATVFDLEAESALKQEWLNSDLGVKNYAYIAGQGEGADRTVVTRYNDPDHPAGEDIIADGEQVKGTLTHTAFTYYPGGYYLEKADDPTIGYSYITGTGIYESKPILLDPLSGYATKSSFKWTYSSYTTGVIPNNSQCYARAYIKAIINGVVYPYTPIDNGQSIPFFDEETEIQAGSTLTFKFELVNQGDDYTPRLSDITLTILGYDPYSSQEWYQEVVTNDAWSSNGASFDKTVALTNGGIKLQEVETGIQALVDNQTQSDWATGTLTSVVAQNVTGEFGDYGQLILGTSTTQKQQSYTETFENGDPKAGGANHPFSVVSDTFTLSQAKSQGEYNQLQYSYRSGDLPGGQGRSQADFTFTFPSGATSMSIDFYYTTGDHLQGTYSVYLDGSSTPLVFGNQSLNGWQHYTVSISTTSTHTLHFIVDNGSIDNQVDDHFYLDNITATYTGAFTGYVQNGYRILPAIALPDKITHSTLTWDEVVPNGCLTSLLALYTTQGTTPPDISFFLPQGDSGTSVRVMIGSSAQDLPTSGNSGKYLWLAVRLWSNQYTNSSPTMSNLKLEVGTAFETTGTYTSEKLYFTNAGQYLNSRISWSASIPSGGSVVGSITYDDGLSWAPVTKEGPLPEFTSEDDLSNTHAQLRFTLTKGTNGDTPIVSSYVIDINQDYLAYEPTGFERRELFIDARDLEDNTSLGDRGKSQMEETKQNSESFSCIIDPYGLFKYGIDWDLGDLVTVQNLYWGITIEKRVVGIKVTQDGDKARPELEVTLGSPWPTIKNTIKKIMPNNGSARS